MQERCGWFALCFANTIGLLTENLFRIPFRRENVCKSISSCQFLFYTVNENYLSQNKKTEEITQTNSQMKNLRFRVWRNTTTSSPQINGRVIMRKINIILVQNVILTIFQNFFTHRLKKKTLPWHWEHFHCFWVVLSLTMQQ